ncbi:MAG TPA: hypothetical protein VGR28_06235, partial [Candidatus Thermoplasmatota archaeon]|nr:hypothetical protein [Candidatus Thermoplasmatota archaeon]
MAARELRLALAALLLVAPALLAAAHGPPLQRQFDPLTLGFALWLGPAGLVLEAPAEAAVPMAGAPGGAAPPLDFQLDVPVRTSLLGGIAAHLVVRADGLVLPRAPGNALLQLEALRGGEPVEGTAEEVAAPATPLQPGASYALDAATGSFPEPLAVGDAVGVRVTFVGTAAGGGLSLLLGPEASRANLTARVAGLDDLGHEHAGWRHLRAQDFGEAERLVDVPVLDLELHHGSPDQTAA